MKQERGRPQRKKKVKRKERGACGGKSDGRGHVRHSVCDAACVMQRGRMSKAGRSVMQMRCGCGALGRTT